MNEDTRSPSVPPEGSFGLQVPASAGSWEAGPARAAGGCRRVHQDVGGDAEEAGITSCPAREAARGAVSKMQGEGKCGLRAEAGPPLAVPALLLGRECPLLGKGWSLPSSTEGTKTGTSSSALPPDRSSRAGRAKSERPFLPEAVGAKTKDILKTTKTSGPEELEGGCQTSSENQ